MSRQLEPKDVRADRPLTARQREFVEHLMTTGETPYAAADKLGTTPSNIYRELRKPHVKQYLAARAREHIGLLSITAMRVQEKLLNADSEHVRAAVAENVLNRHLGKPIERKQVALQASMNVTIDLG